MTTKHTYRLIVTFHPGRDRNYHWQYGVARIALRGERELQTGVASGSTSYRWQALLKAHLAARVHARNERLKDKVYRTEVLR